MRNWSHHLGVILFSIKPINMQDPHLLHDGAFTRFSSTQQQQAVRGPVDLLVLLQLLLDLFVGLALRLLLVALVLGLTVSEAAHGGGGGGARGAAGLRRRRRRRRGRARAASRGRRGPGQGRARARLLGEERAGRTAGRAGRVVSVWPSRARGSRPLEPKPRGLMAAADRGGPEQELRELLYCFKFLTIKYFHHGRRYKE